MFYAKTFAGTDQPKKFGQVNLHIAYNYATITSLRYAVQADC